MNLHHKTCDCSTTHHLLIRAIVVDNCEWLFADYTHSDGVCYLRQGLNGQLYKTVFDADNECTFHKRTTWFLITDEEFSGVILPALWALKMMCVHVSRAVQRFRGHFTNMAWWKTTKHCSDLLRLANWALSTTAYMQISQHLSFLATKTLWKALSWLDSHFQGWIVKHFGMESCRSKTWLETILHTICKLKYKPSICKPVVLYMQKYIWDRMLFYNQRANWSLQNPVKKMA